MGPESFGEPVSRGRTFLLVRLAFGGCVLNELLSRLEYGVFASFLASPIPLFLTINLLCFLLDRALMTVRWHVLLKAGEVFISLKVSPYGKLDYVIYFLNHALLISVVYFVSLSLNLEIFILNLCVLLSLVLFMAVLPVSLSGTGAQEGADVYFLSNVTLSVQQGLAMALPVRMVTAAGCFPGVFPVLMSGVRAGKAVVVRS